MINSRNRTVEEVRFRGSSRNLLFIELPMGEIEYHPFPGPYIIPASPINLWLPQLALTKDPSHCPNFLVSYPSTSRILLQSYLLSLISPVQILGLLFISIIMYLQLKYGYNIFLQKPILLLLIIFYLFSFFFYFFCL